MTSSTSLSLGEYLRQERERRGLTIEQVASATKINIRLLHALEADHYADLPAVPFIRGFVNSYVRFLGLDAQEVLTQFDQFIENKAQERPNREAGLSGYAFEKREGEQSRTALWIVMAVFLVLGAIFIVFLKPHFKHRHESHAEKLRVAHPHANGSSSPDAAVSGAPLSDGASPSPSSSPSMSPSPSPSPEVSHEPVVAHPLTPAPSPVVSAVPVKKTEPVVSVEVKPSAVPVSPASKAVGPSLPAPSESPAKDLLKDLKAPKAEESPLPTVPSEKDPLASGRDLKPDEIKQKVVFKALDDVWVRYQLDRRPIMKFVLRKDKILVLRAADVIHFQSSNPDALSYSWNAKAYQLLSKKVTPQKQITFPAQETTNPFKEEKSLPLAPSAAPKAPETPEADDETEAVPSPSETSQKPPSPAE